MHTISLQKNWDPVETHMSLYGGLEIGKGNYIQQISESRAPVLILKPNRKLDYEPGTVISLNRRRETFSVLDADEAVTALWVAYQDWSFADMHMKSLIQKNANEILNRLLANFPVTFSPAKAESIRKKIPAVLENASRNFRLLRQTFGIRDTMKFECLFKAHLRAVMTDSYPEFRNRLMLNGYLLSWCCLSSRMKTVPTSEQFDLFVGTTSLRTAWENELIINPEFAKVFKDFTFDELEMGHIEYLFLGLSSFDDCTD